jgi:hypothetical protein
MRCCFIIIFSSGHIKSSCSWLSFLSPFFDGRYLFFLLVHNGKSVLLFPCYSFGYVIASGLCSYTLLLFMFVCTLVFHHSLLERVICSDLWTVLDEWWLKDVQDCTGRLYFYKGCNIGDLWCSQIDHAFDLINLSPF